MNPRSYPPNIARLLQSRDSMGLDAGKPALDVVEVLDSSFLERLFGGKIIINKTSARLCVAGLWLLYDHLDKCHEIAQSVETADGNYWHAMMHRREGDFSNSKYWYRRVGTHGIFHELMKQSSTVIGAHDSFHALAGKGAWDAFVFVDLCEKAIHDLPDLQMACRQVQQCEWQLLFEHCYQKAVGE